MNLLPSKSKHQIDNMNLINIPSIETEIMAKDRPEEPTVGRVLLPEEANELPVECKDLLLRLMKYDPSERIRSIFAIQRTAMFKGFDFEKAKRKEVICLSEMKYKIIQLKNIQLIVVFVLQFVVSDRSKAIYALNGRHIRLSSTK